ncbi:amidinotransferase [Agrobacterium sp. CCNWLW71]|uniref:amidinotransferase n=1 Tax=unclassified Agrobacterium TaxID=2632611 RepID=UPI002FEFE3CB
MSISTATSVSDSRDQAAVPSPAKSNSLINVHNEWDPLEEVLVGTAIGAQVPTGDKGLFAIRYSDYADIDSMPTGPRSKRIVEETEEDLDAVIRALRQQGVTIRRPEPTDHTVVFKTPDWEADGMYNYCPRDIMLPIGNTIIETPMSMRSRFFEPFAYKNLLIEYLKSGARWISAPKPRLLDTMYNATDPESFALLENEPVFDAANCLRIGRDILYQVSDTGNKLGAEWLQSTLGSDYRVHACDNLYANTHIDTTISLLRPGLVLVNPSRINEDNLPSIFKKWDVLYAPEPIDVGYTEVAYGSAWIFSMNLLMVNPSLAMVDKSQLPLIKLLEKHNIDCIPLQLRHARTLSGGFHCVTLDVRRTGTLEDYS